MPQSLSNSESTKSSKCSAKPRYVCTFMPHLHLIYIQSSAPVCVCKCAETTCGRCRSRWSGWSALAVAAFWLLRRTLAMRYVRALFVFVLNQNLKHFNVQFSFLNLIDISKWLMTHTNHTWIRCENKNKVKMTTWQGMVFVSPCKSLIWETILFATYCGIVLVSVWRHLRKSYAFQMRLYKPPLHKNNKNFMWNFYYKVR